MDATSVSSFENPCELVRSTCRKWMEEEGLVVAAGNDGDGENCVAVRDWNDSAEQDPRNLGRRSVRIRHERLPALANEILAQGQAPGEEKMSEESWIEWDTEGWHYTGKGFKGTEEERRERVALYMLALDAINFCFWPLPGDSSPAATTNNSNNLLEYEHLAMALKHMAEADHDELDRGSYAFSAKNLSTMTPEKMIDSLGPHLDQQKYPVPNLEQRAQLWKEVGDGLLRDYDGSALALLDRAEQDAPRLVELVATSFPGFRDEAFATSRQQQQQEQQQQQPERERFVFLKRAQIFVGDINAALNLKLGGMERLTTFADYRVPQILRHRGILEYAPGPTGLASRVDRRVELDSGSCDEISIRAATVVGVEELVKLLNERETETDAGAGAGADTDANNKTVFTDVTVDWYLWQVGERMHQEGAMKPFHKVRTHFY